MNCFTLKFKKSLETNLSLLISVDNIMKIIIILVSTNQAFMPRPGVSPLRGILSSPRKTLLSIPADSCQRATCRHWKPDVSSLHRLVLFPPDPVKLYMLPPSPDPLFPRPPGDYSNVKCQINLRKKRKFNSMLRQQQCHVAN